MTFGTESRAMSYDKASVHETVRQLGKFQLVLGRTNALLADGARVPYTVNRGTQI